VLHIGRLKLAIIRWHNVNSVWPLNCWGRWNIMVSEKRNRNQPWSMEILTSPSLWGSFQMMLMCCVCCYILWRCEAFLEVLPSLSLSIIMWKRKLFCFHVFCQRHWKSETADTYFHFTYLHFHESLPHTLCTTRLFTSCSDNTSYRWTLFCSWKPTEFDEKSLATTKVHT
jgi:hypothetical protein